MQALKPFQRHGRTPVHFHPRSATVRTRARPARGKRRSSPRPAKPALHAACPSSRPNASCLRRKGGPLFVAHHIRAPARAGSAARRHWLRAAAVCIPPAMEHTIRLLRPTRHEIIHQHRHIGHVAARRNGWRPSGAPHVDRGPHPLSGGLLKPTVPLICPASHKPAVPWPPAWLKQYRVHIVRNRWHSRDAPSWHVSRPGCMAIMASCTSSGRLVEMPYGVAILPFNPSGSIKTWCRSRSGNPRHLVLHEKAVARARAFNDAREQRERSMPDLDASCVRSFGPRHINTHLRLSGLCARKKLKPGAGSSPAVPPFAKNRMDDRSSRGVVPVLRRPGEAVLP